MTRRTPLSRERIIAAAAAVADRAGVVSAALADGAAQGSHPGRMTYRRRQTEQARGVPAGFARAAAGSRSDEREPVERGVRGRGDLDPGGHDATAP